MNFEKFKEIRKAYAWELVEWMEDYEETGNMWHDPYFIDWEFTPIERNVWGDIRGVGIPFYPQLPALNYFLDFGNPFLKIGIECDGNAWHDHKKDRIRDDRLESDGWMIFRLEGHECVREVEPEVEYEEEPDPEAWRKHYMTTSCGVIRAIKEQYFNNGAQVRYPYLVASTLFNHRSTEERDVVLKEVKQSSRLVRASELLPEYLAFMQRRARRAA